MNYLANGTQVTPRPARVAIQGTPGFAQAGNPVTGVQASIFDNDTFNDMMMEIINVILASGQTPSELNLSQLLNAIKGIRPGGIPSYQIFTAVGTGAWIVPTGVTQCMAFVQGGGGSGGGGGTTETAGNAGSGGCGGGFSYKTITGLVAGTSIPVVVGSGAAPGATPAANGNPGGTSSFGSYCSATGGGGGTAPVGNESGYGPGVPGYGTGGDVNKYGGVGGVASPVLATSGSVVLQSIPGFGGTAGDGSPGAPGQANAGNLGAGGGGGDDTVSGATGYGGSGGNGYVIVWW